MSGSLLVMELYSVVKYILFLSCGGGALRGCNSRALSAYLTLLKKNRRKLMG